MPKKEFIASYLEITCVYYILLYYHDLQSGQVGQGKDVAITTPTQSTLCTLGHQAVPRLASGLNSMWHTFTTVSVKRRIIWLCTPLGIHSNRNLEADILDTSSRP